MDNKNQNNIPNPDYGFILNQAPVGGVPKKRDKKVLAIIVLLVVLAMVIVLAVVLSARSKVATNNTPATTSTPVTAEQVSKQFFTDVQNDKADDAYKLLSASFQSRQNFDTFKGTFVGVMRPNLTIADCKYDAVNTQANTQKVICPMQNGKASLAFIVSFETIEQNGSQKTLIKDLAWTPSAPLTITDIKQNNAVQ